VRAADSLNRTIGLSRVVAPYSFAETIQVAPDEDSEHRGFPIVGMGASAGGPSEAK
jgi:hypothetical protein